MRLDDSLATSPRLDLLSLLDQFQDAVETAAHVPMTDRIVVSSDVLLDLIDAIRNTIPHDVIEAERVLQERHRLLEEARDEAERMVEDAREQSKFMLQDHHVLKAAEIRAERIANQAQREADEIIESAEDYVQQLFTRLQEEALRVADEIRRVSARRS